MKVYNPGDILICVRRLDREIHEMGESRERPSCVSCPFAPFVFQDCTQAELDALPLSVLDWAFRGEL